MRRHLLRIFLIYTVFEVLRELGSSIALYVRGQYPFRWIVGGPQDHALMVSGYFIFILYPLFSFIIFETQFRKSKKRTQLYWLLLSLVVVTLRFLVEERLYPALYGFRNYRADVSLFYYYLDNLYFAALYSAFGIIYFFLISDHQHQLHQKNLMLINKQTELSFLRSQVNPHFLFNSLNNIYSLVYHKSDQSLTAIAKLSDLLRYMLYDSNELVPLQKELDYIHKYMELQQLRFDYTLPATLELSGNPGKASIPPLLLIPFVENAFKHGDVRKGSTIRMRLHVDDQVIRFGISNHIGVQQKDAGGGIGLENVRRRLELLYPDHHKLEVRQTTNIFEVELEISR
ncbi:sensor histidine kinase [Paraflavitalea pollutisoli]|uniref:sensor histidine kinase n=1 Tax=Paraflavitalea pollutisoli TaxID=3034143 RepID=UPI0023ED55F6|nr:histidine kinase [Paraflavitalea sp. H1-2-19X]